MLPISGLSKCFFEEYFFLIKDGCSGLRVLTTPKFNPGSGTYQLCDNRASYLNSLNFNFLMCKMGKVTVFHISIIRTK